MEKETRGWGEKRGSEREKGGQREREKGVREGELFTKMTVQSIRGQQDGTDRWHKVYIALR